jgi:hypothetical protein
MVAVWARSTLFDSDRWAELAGQVIRDPEVVEGVSLRLSTALVEGLDVQQRIESALSQAGRLPPQAELLAGPVTDGIRQRLDDRIADLLRLPEVQRLWVEANRKAHEAIVRVLRGETRPGVSVEGGTVTLNLLPLIDRALAATGDLLSNLLGREIHVPTAEEIAAAGTLDNARHLLEERLGVELPMTSGRSSFSARTASPRRRRPSGCSIGSCRCFVVTLILLAAALVRYSGSAADLDPPGRRGPARCPGRPLPHRSDPGGNRRPGREPIPGRRP